VVREESSITPYLTLGAQSSFKSEINLIRNPKLLESRFRFKLIPKIVRRLFAFWGEMCIVNLLPNFLVLS
jgi:hypothetical protein